MSPVGSCVSLDTETSFASISKSIVIEGSWEKDVDVDDNRRLLSDFFVLHFVLHVEGSNFECASEVSLFDLAGFQ